jgi:hypothetical protein
VTRSLLALAVLLALAASLLAGWWLLGPRSPVDQAQPSAAPRGADAAPSELVAAGAGAGARRESAAAAAAATGAAPRAGDPAGGLGVEVVVLDPQGRPVAGARVLLLEPVQRQASCDALGRARVEVPTTARRLDLRVEAEGYAHAHAQQAVAARVEVTLYPAGHAIGRVIEQGTLLAIAAATVRLEDEHDGCEAAVARSAADGSFEIAPVPVGTAFALVASAQGFADARVPLRLLSDGPTDGIELVLEPSAGVRLRVSDFLTGQPVTSARLVVPADPPAADGSGLIDAGRLVPASAQWAWIRVEAPGYCLLTRRLLAAEWREPLPVPVPLLAAARFEGTVVDDRGRPVAGAEVLLASQGAGSSACRTPAGSRASRAGRASGRWRPSACARSSPRRTAASGLPGCCPPRRACSWRSPLPAGGPASSTRDGHPVPVRPAGSRSAWSLRARAPCVGG